MRFALAITALLTIAAPAAARRSEAPVPTPTVSDRVAALSVGAGESVSIDDARTDYLGDTLRMALDLRFGPADTREDGAAVWNARSDGRGNCMLAAGISRIVYRVVDGRAVVTATGLPAAGTVVMAAR